MIAIASDVRDSTLVGRVAANHVVLHRVRPFLSNVYKPYFYGRFVTENNKAVLKGQFTMSLFTRLVGKFMLVFIAALEAISILNFIGSKNISDLYPIGYIFGIAVLGLVGQILLKEWSRKDVEWISKEINSALS
jgi:hypothetical protein